MRPAGPWPAVAPGVAVLLLAGCGQAATGTTPAAGALPASASGGDLLVLAAASLTGTLDEVGDGFEADNPGVAVTVSYGGSSGLVQQVVSGAPADVLVTASPATMAEAVEAGAVAGEPEVLASNELVLAVPVDDPGGVTSLADLADPDLLVALCAPQVPCGAAAARVLDEAGVAAQPDTLEQDVRAVLTRLTLGEVDAGLVYRTDVLAAGDAVSEVRLDPALREAASTDYPVAVLAGAGDPALAERFVAHLRSPAGADVLREAGFVVAEPVP